VWDLAPNARSSRVLDGPGPRPELDTQIARFDVQVSYFIVVMSVWAFGSRRKTQGSRVSDQRPRLGVAPRTMRSWDERRGTLRAAGRSIDVWYSSCCARLAMSVRAPAVILLLAAAWGLVTNVAWAAGSVPPATELPQTLSMDEALLIFRTRGLELLIAQAAVTNAEGAVKIAGAVPNPAVNAGIGDAFTYTSHDPSCEFRGPSTAPTNYVECTNTVWSVGVSDSAAIEDSLSGKRDLRYKVARNALAAAKMSRVDAERTIAFQVESAYLQVAQAMLGYKFAKDVADSNTTILNKFKVKFATGAINDGDLARMETQKAESDQALDTAAQTLRQARVALAFLLGVRGEVPDFDVDTKVLDYSVPSELAGATEVGLLRAAFDRRPDLIAAGYTLASAEAQLALVKRQKFPDITLSLNYAQGGYGGTGTNAALQSPMLTFGVSAPLPVFYQLQGETKQAEAQIDTNALQHAMTAKQVVSDVDTAFAAFVASQKLVVRMEKGDPGVRPILESAKAALDITRLQYDKGAASLSDFLLALQTYIATKVEYFGDLTNYWTAVYQLEEAVGMELHR
jgi:outer membrane protein, heavy metal efflux system